MATRRAATAQLMQRRCFVGAPVPCVRAPIRESAPGQLIAAQLNVYNGAHAPGWQPGTDIVGTDVITEAVKFLRGMGPFVGYSDGSTGNVEKYGTAGVLDTGTSGNVDFNTSTLQFAVGSLSTSSAAWSQAVKVDLVSNVFVNGNDLANSLEAFNADGTKLMISKDGYSVGWGATGTPQDIHANTSSGVWAVLKDAGLIHG